MNKDLNKIFNHIKYLTGFVFQKGDKDLNLTKLFKSGNYTSEYTISNIIGPIKEIDNWFNGEIISKEPLKSERGEGPFKYDFFYKEKAAASKILILTENRDIARILLGIIQFSDRNFVPLRIDTANILETVMSIDKNSDTTVEYENISKDYVITFVHAKISGMQQKLFSMSLYGRDVIRSAVYESFNHNMESISCGIGIEEDSFSGYSEIVRLNNDGLVKFNTKNIFVFNNIRDVITFIRDTKSFISP